MPCESFQNSGDLNMDPNAIHPLQKETKTCAPKQAVQ